MRVWVLWRRAYSCQLQALLQLLVPGVEVCIVGGGGREGGRGKLPRCCRPCSCCCWCLRLLLLLWSCLEALCRSGAF